MIGIIQRFGMASELSHRKNTVFLLNHKKILLENSFLSMLILNVVCYSEPTDILLIGHLCR